MFDTADTVYDCTRIATGVLSTIAIRPAKMRAGLSADMLATDLAEYLVRKVCEHNCCTTGGLMEGHATLAACALAVRLWPNPTWRSTLCSRYSCARHG